MEFDILKIDLVSESVLHIKSKHDGLIYKTISNIPFQNCFVEVAHV